MSRLLILVFSHHIVLSIRYCVRATNNSVLTVSTNIAFNALHALICILTVLTKKIPYTIYNCVAIYYICQHCQCRTRISNAFNAIYVDTVNTKHIHTFLPITFLIQYSTDFQSTKSFEKLRLRPFQPYQCYVCQTFFRLNIKKVMSKNVNVPYFSIT